MKNVPVVLVALSVLLALSATPSAGHDAPNRCGHKKQAGAGWYRVRGHGVKCSVARTVARRWEKKCLERNECRGRGRVTIHAGGHRFRCRDKAIPNSDFGTRVQCLGPGEKIVHFRWAA